jgi:hypothetical protein
VLESSGIIQSFFLCCIISNLWVRLFYFFLCCIISNLWVRLFYCIYIYIPIYLVTYVLNHPPSASRLRRGGLLALGAGECGLGFEGKVKG